MSRSLPLARTLKDGLFLAALLLAACNFAPKYSRPSTQTPPAFKELAPKNLGQTNAWKTAEPKDHAPRDAWWELFGDPRLNELEQRASATNQSVAAARATFLAARALVKQARSQLFPLVTANPSVTKSQQSSTFSQNQTVASSRTFNITTFSLPFDASWEPDLWGSVRNTTRAATRQAQAAFGDLENLLLTVRAEVAADYFQLQALDAQKQLLDSTVVAFRESLKLTQARFQTGIASDQDVAQAETQLNTTQAQATDLGIQRAQLEHALAVLVGSPAPAFSLPFVPLEARPVAIPVRVPSTLLERRPDIAAAERRTAAANAQIGVARAAFFPTVTLSGSAGFQSSSLSTLVISPSFAWSLGAALAQTIFDAGRRKGVTEQAWANYQAAIANYRQTVLTAFQEVEDNLSTLRILSQELREQDAAVAASQRFLELANNRYKLGIDSYLNVITAQTTLLANQRTAVNLRMQQMTASVQLIKALGGGWTASGTGLEQDSNHVGGTSEGLAH